MCKSSWQSKNKNCSSHRLRVSPPSTFIMPPLSECQKHQCEDYAAGTISLPEEMCFLLYSTRCLQQSLKTTCKISHNTQVYIHTANITISAAAHYKYEKANSIISMAQNVTCWPHCGTLLNYLLLLNLYISTHI